jgi:hypothetical protein
MEAVNRQLRKMHALERVKYVKEILRSAVQGLSDRDILGIVLQLEHYRQGRRKEIGPLHRTVYDVLLKHELCPKTVYTWLLLERAPSHVKDKLRDGRVSMRNASSMSVAWKRMVSTKAGKDIVAQMRAVIGGLQWRGQEELKTRL